MAFQANILNLMVASPGDVAKERDIICAEVIGWNAAHSSTRRLFLNPLRWETHSSPQLGAHPQKLINDQVLSEADIVVGIFGTRIGTATPEYLSGSVEEIKRHVAAGKLVMLYFSKVPIDPNLLDSEQWEAVKAFKEECRSNGLYAEYETHDQLRHDFAHHLNIELNKAKYVWMRVPQNEVEVSEPELSAEEVSLLTNAASDKYGTIINSTTMDGFYVQTNGKNFVQPGARPTARWKKILDRMQDMGYLKRESNDILVLTEEGFERADTEASKSPLELDLKISGSPDNQSLELNANRPITACSLEFLTSQDIQVSEMKLSETVDRATPIVIDYDKVRELVNAPRADKSGWDHSGPAKLRFRFLLGGSEREVVLPVLLEPKMVNSTQWFAMRGAQRFTVLA